MDPQGHTPRGRLLTVRHRTTYLYSAPVELGEHRMLFRPRESHDLRLLRSELHITPPPASLRWLHDVFDNSAAIATFTGQTAELCFDSTVSLEHLEAPLPSYALDLTARSYPFAYADDDLPDLAGALRRRHPSPEIQSWARTFLPYAGGIDTMELLQSMTSGIRQQFAYMRRDAKGIQSPDETLRLGQGTCRDFALLMIEAVRALGFAARFVSGYIFVPVFGGDMVGGGATHAWLQVYLPGAGWVDFDPTNSIVGNRDLIRVAVAWDPHQVLPLWGTFRGLSAVAHDMTVDVSVVEQARAST